MKADRLPNPANVSPFKPVIHAFEGNKSGVQPIGTKVLVMPDQIADKVGSIMLPGDTVERNSLAVTTGTVIAVGAGAFSDWANADKETYPKPGDRVHIAKYAGLVIDGMDGEQHRLVQDVEICGICI